MKRTPLEKTLVGPAGEHYVLFRLYQHGVLASLAPPGAPVADILVLTTDATVAATVQVKARTRGSDGGWPMRDVHETIEHDGLFYAFVDLEPESPVTYIVPSAVVAKVLRDAHAAWLAAPGRGGRPHRDNPIRKLRPEYPSLPDYGLGWLDKYRERWDLLMPAS
jgi:hypothetical protein